ncbi:MAG: hypothetical protein GXO23_00570 [Crenarchaeota archaeon]|nr:hypothetical protein [Thermoproteota archaeon]
MFSRLPRKTVLILRTLWKHSRPPYLQESYDIIELKIVRPVKTEDINGDQSTDVAIFMSSIAVKMVESIKIVTRYVIPVGDDTEREIVKSRNIEYRTLLRPDHYSSVGIVKLLGKICREDSSIRNVHVYRSAHGSDLISRECEKLGLNVREFRLYKLEPINTVLRALPQLLDTSNIVIAMSGIVLETAYRYLTDIGANRKLLEKNIIVPGPEAARKARSLGIERLYIASNADMESIFQLVKKILGEDGKHNPATDGPAVQFSTN